MHSAARQALKKFAGSVMLLAGAEEGDGPLKKGVIRTRRLSLGS
jgi:hypothetical protein